MQFFAILRRWFSRPHPLPPDMRPEYGPWLPPPDSVWWHWRGGSWEPTATALTSRQERSEAWAAWERAHPDERLSGVITTWADFRAHFVPLACGCWRWIGPCPSLYGRGSFEGRDEQAHNIGFIVMHGARDPARVRDHVCCYQLCVNPFHLEQVTSGENIRRGYQRRREEIIRRLLGAPPCPRPECTVCSEEGQVHPAFAQHRCCVPLR